MNIVSVVVNHVWLSIEGEVEMPADLTKPFAESCCDGGICSTNEKSCQPCGCDKGAKWICQRHQMEARIKDEAQRVRDVRDDEE